MFITLKIIIIIFKIEIDQVCCVLLNVSRVAVCFC